MTEGNASSTPPPPNLWRSVRALRRCQKPPSPQERWSNVTTWIAIQDISQILVFDDIEAARQAYKPDETQFRANPSLMGRSPRTRTSNPRSVMIWAFPCEFRGRPELFGLFRIPAVGFEPTRGFPPRGF